MQYQQEQQHLSAPLASRGSRFLGSLIDSILILTVFFPIVFGLVLNDSVKIGEELTFSQTLLFMAIGWVIFLGLNGYLLLKRGQTLGKVMFKTRIVDLEGRIPSLPKLLLMRYGLVSLLAQVPVLGSLFGLANALAIFGEDRRCLHDYIAGTRVVQVSEIYE